MEGGGRGATGAAGGNVERREEGAKPEADKRSHNNMIMSDIGQ